MMTWTLFNIFLLTMVILDLSIWQRKRQANPTKEALVWSGIWLFLALCFGGGIFLSRGTEAGFQFVTGYIIEESLSIDNLLLFTIIFRQFSVPPAYQHRVLFWGVISALIMRLGLILCGATVISQYHWVLYLFGAFLILTGIKILFTSETEPDFQKSWLLSFLKRWIPLSAHFDQQKFFTKENGKRVATPLFLVLLLIECGDLIFAIDSIPAIFAITQDPFLIYTSNAFAIMGLRSLYFALSGLIERFRYLKTGLSIILVFIGGKMLLSKIYSIPSGVSLLITLSILGGSIFLSLRKTR